MFPLTRTEAVCIDDCGPLLISFLASSASPFWWLFLWLNTHIPPEPVMTDGPHPHSLSTFFIGILNPLLLKPYGSHHYGSPNPQSWPAPSHGLVPIRTLRGATLALWQGKRKSLPSLGSAWRHVSQFELRVPFLPINKAMKVYTARSAHSVLNLQNFSTTVCRHF